MRLGEKKRELIKALEGFESPALESTLILEKALSLSPAEQILKYDYPLNEEEKDKIDSLFKRRLSHEPAAYILEEKEFYGLPFFVNENVLIPRPDTETLVETALKFLRDKKNPKVLDLCTGSGCVGISIAKNHTSDLTLSDISAEALEVASRNAKVLIGDGVKIVESDLFSNLEGEKFDLIVSNPPYLTDCWYETLEDEVKREPKLALIGFDSDGLGIIRKIISQSAKYLKRGSALALECDFRQSGECAKVMEINGFSEIVVVKDLALLDRVVIGKYGNA